MSDSLSRVARQLELIADAMARFRRG